MDEPKLLRWEALTKWQGSPRFFRQEPERA